MSEKGDRPAGKKTLSDADIATFARRPGPMTDGSGTDADSDAHAHTDSDQAKHTDKDS